MDVEGGNVRGVEDTENVDVEGGDAFDNVTGDVGWDDVGNEDGEGGSEAVVGMGGIFDGIDENAGAVGVAGFVAIEADSVRAKVSRDCFDLGFGWVEDGAVGGISAVLREALTVGAEEPADDGIDLWIPDCLS